MCKYCPVFTQSKPKSIDLQVQITISIDLHEDLQKQIVLRLQNSSSLDIWLLVNIQFTKPVFLIQLVLHLASHTEPHFTSENHEVCTDSWGEAITVSSSKHSSLSWIQRFMFFLQLHSFTSCFVGLCTSSCQGLISSSLLYPPSALSEPAWLKSAPACFGTLLPSKKLCSNLQTFTKKTLKKVVTDKNPLNHFQSANKRITWIFRWTGVLACHPQPCTEKEESTAKYLQHY